MYNDTPSRDRILIVDIQTTASAILGQLVGIAPTLIAVRVGLGQSVDNVESLWRRKCALTNRRCGIGWPPLHEIQLVCQRFAFQQRVMITMEGGGGMIFSFSL
ncbi:hypothetical protein B0H13DRAFT_1884357 [Mycena leptocephala]|nr:hypothetical protein B0H13DRAFT_1884357 [Mycena leptocephala]